MEIQEIKDINRTVALIEEHKEVINYIQKNEGCVQKQILLELQIVSISGIISELEEVGIIRKEREGKWKKHFTTRKLQEYLKKNYITI